MFFNVIGDKIYRFLRVDYKPMVSNNEYYRSVHNDMCSVYVPDQLRNKCPSSQAMSYTSMFEVQR